MLDWLRRPLTHTVSALFRGPVPPRLGELHGLAAAGIEVEAREAKGDAHWAATLVHPEWGTARVDCPRRPELPLALGPQQSDLEPAELHELERCESAIEVSLRGRERHVLRDRKNAYRFARCLLGDRGVAALDQLSLHFWSLSALDDELAHDADLGVDGLISLHAVQSHDGSGEVDWLHSHGLAEVGRFDFDLLRPSPALLANVADLSASLVFSILEGSLDEDTPRATIAEPGGQVRLVPARRFQATARPVDKAVRDDPAGTHSDRRTVLCEPVGLLGSLFGGAVRRSRWVESADPERAVFLFSTAASELIAERARSTWEVFRSLYRELEDLRLPCIAKIGFDTDPGSPVERENLWLEVANHATDTVTGTIANQPFHVHAVRDGDRGTYPIEQLVDWRILTPLGPIQPSSLAIARRVRAHRDEVAAIVNERPS